MSDGEQNEYTTKPIEETPNEAFSRMAANDHKQNRRLSEKISTSMGHIGPIKKTDKGPTKTRFLVCTLGLVALAMSQMSRMVLNLSITSMVVEVTKNEDVSTDGSCPWPEELVVTETSHEETTPAIDDIIMEVETVTDSNEPIVASNATLVEYERYDWTFKQQTQLLGGFYYSYFFFMILSGRMAEIYGAKYILLLAVGGSGLINLLTPWMARTSFWLLFSSRVLLGAVQAGVMPGMYALFNKWLTMSEASIYAPLIKTNLRLGMLLGSLLPGLLAGWPNTFYLTGILNVTWSIAWCIVATSEPKGNKWVSEGELKHILRKKRKQPEPEKVPEGLEMKEKNGNKDNKDQKQESTTTTTKTVTSKSGTPWLRIITAAPVLGLIIAKVTFNYALDFLGILLPTYLKNVHHASRQTISAITTTMYLLQVVLIVFIGWSAKAMVQKSGLSKTNVRKLFQSIASFGIGIALFALTFNDCNLVFVGLVLQMVSFLFMFSAGGETMLPYDLSDEYPATIMGIANSIANMSSISTTALAGFILGQQRGSYERWNLLIYLIAGAQAIGGCAFVTLVKAEPIDFHSKRKRTKSTSSRRLELGDLEEGEGGTASSKKTTTNEETRGTFKTISDEPIKRPADKSAQVNGLSCSNECDSNERRSAKE